MHDVDKLKQRLIDPWNGMACDKASSTTKLISAANVSVRVFVWKDFEKRRPSQIQQKSPAVADKPTRRESMPKSPPIRRAYNVVADNTGLSSFV